MDAPVPLIVVAALAALALLARGPRARATVMLLALLLTPVLLIAHIYDSAQFRPLRDHAGLAVGAGAGGLVVVGLLAWLFVRRPPALALAAAFTIPFRIPIGTGGGTANLLVPLYVVIAAGTIAYAWPILFGPDDPPEEPRPRVLEWALGGYLLLYAIQAAYSSDFARALEQVVFFYVPFALLYVLLARLEWSRRLLAGCLGVLAGLALAFACIGFVEYGTRHLLLNPKVIASNQLESYFRVNSLFFDPNIYGRFLAIVMVFVTAAILRRRGTGEVAAGGAALAVLWAGLVLTLSQSSFVALLVGLAILGGLTWSGRWALGLSLIAIALGAGFLAVAPNAVHLDLGSSKSADTATSGRYGLITGGIDLFRAKPLAGYGSGAFPREYRRHTHASAQRATSASHTIPITVAAEQGVVGLAVYLALLAAAFWRLFDGARGIAARCAVAAAFAALVVHTFMYAAFLEDPLAWALLGVGTALARAMPRLVRHRRPPAAVPEDEPVAAPAAVRSPAQA
ncbi:MAG TPA: O-antigen ligase family protein [Solirubrobacteraceae bacterium]|nr:O-antigen ligase family protein [Solirubrobacteraceae bacterium]